MWRRPWLGGILLLTAFCTLWAEAAQVQRGKFQTTYLEFIGRRQDYVAYDFNGDGRLDILVSSINFDDDPPTRWFSLFLQSAEGKYPAKASQVWPISNKACALLFGRFLPDAAGAVKATQICFIARDGVYAYVWRDGRMDPQPVKLVHTETFFSEQSDIAIPILQQQDDFDGNGLDDLIVPLRQGYKIYMQTEPGRFSRVSRIALETEHYPVTNNRKAASFIVYRELPKLEAVDVNGDGRKDLVTVRRNVMLTYFQNAQGLFESTPRRCKIGTLVESRDKNKIDLSFVALTDLNNDRMADLVVTKIQGTLGLFDSVKSYLYIYFGNGKGIFLNPDRAMLISGVTIPPDLTDIDQDGCKDIIVTSVPTDLMDNLRKLIMQNIEITFMISTYKKESKNYDGNPDFTRRASTSIKDVEKSMLGGVPLLYFRGDHSGDGRPDMVMLQTDMTLEIRLGESVPNLDGSLSPTFKKDEYFKTTLERFPKGLDARDLNGDKKDDILLIYNGTLGVLMSEK